MAILGIKQVEKAASKTKNIIECLCVLYGPTVLLKNPYGGHYPINFTSCFNNYDVGCNGTGMRFKLIEDNRIFKGYDVNLKKILGQRKAWNGETLILMVTPEEHSGILQVAKGRYFDALISSYLARQMLLGVDTFESNFRGTCTDNDNLNREHSQSGHFCINWKNIGISAALSVSTALVIFDGQRYCLAFAKRSCLVAEDPGKYHLLPSMLLQPQGLIDGERVYDIVLNMVLQELGEELFGVDEGKNKTVLAITDLMNRMQTGSAAFHITGIANDLCTLRPEITSVLIVRDSQWLSTYRQYFQLCHFEYEQSDVSNNGDTSSGLRLEPFDIQALLAPSGPFAPGACVDTAAACLIAALPYCSI